MMLLDIKFSKLVGKLVKRYNFELLHNNSLKEHIIYLQKLNEQFKKTIFPLIKKYNEEKDSNKKFEFFNQIAIEKIIYVATFLYYKIDNTNCKYIQEEINFIALLGLFVSTYEKLITNSVLINLIKKHNKPF